MITQGVLDMKRVISNSVAKWKDRNDIQYKYTADEIVDLLSQIEELKDRNVYCSKSSDGNTTFVVGNSAYRIVEDKPAE